MTTLDAFDAAAEARAILAFVTEALGMPALVENMDDHARAGMFRTLRHAETILEGIVEHLRPGPNRDGCRCNGD